MRSPTLVVFKENSYYFFEDGARSDTLDLSTLNTTMYEWINAERFATFPQVTRGNIHQLLQTKKYLVLAVVKENKLQEVTTDMIEFRDMVESVIKKNRDKFHRWFQFGWVGSPDLANSIAMTVLPLPHLLVVNSTTNHHHIPEDDPSQLTPEAITIFLEQIHNQSVPAYGGNTWLVRVYRTYFEARTSLAEMWQGNPVLTAVLFGLPMGFLSLICYSICCADIMDADEEDEERGRTTSLHILNSLDYPCVWCALVVTDRNLRTAASFPRGVLILGSVYVFFPSRSSRHRAGETGSWFPTSKSGSGSAYLEEDQQIWCLRSTGQQCVLYTETSGNL
uniref:Protein disulfide-isomerase TMX3 n=1 Tax=Timema poppense TaxID=170557 RepID=A0A7R9DES4_TIMPO|nr:unnamed protein product [Timema poppensis]